MFPLTSLTPPTTKGLGTKLVLYTVLGQRREDMTSHRSENLDVLITFQGQESQMQVTRMALWTKSQWALSVFYYAKPSGKSKLVIMAHLAG